jgi:bifunctional non-homologous end joining protein LigD
MLIGNGEPAQGVSGWVAEPKLDGWRCQVAIDPELSEGFEVRTRSGRTVTGQLPELRSLADLGVRVVLDGGLVAGAGRSDDFYGVAPSMARRDRRTGLSFAAFDLLWCDGESVIDEPLAARRRLLDHLAVLTDRAVLVVRQFDATDVETMLACCEDLGIEGLVLKRSLSRYVPGQRSKDWRKVKCASWRRQHSERRRPRR